MIEQTFGAKVRRGSLPCRSNRLFVSLMGARSVIGCVKTPSRYAGLTEATAHIRLHGNWLTFLGVTVGYPYAPHQVTPRKWNISSVS